MLTGKRQKEIGSVSGFEVPVLANGNESRFMISIIKVFYPTIKNADKKSFLIWIVPCLAVILFFVSQYFEKNKWVRLSISIICLMVLSFALFKIVTADLNKVVLRIRIAYGLWFVITGYLAFGILEFSSFLGSKRK